MEGVEDELKPVVVQPSEDSAIEELVCPASFNFIALIANRDTGKINMESVFLRGDRPLGCNTTSRKLVDIPRTSTDYIVTLACHRQILRRDIEQKCVCKRR